MDSTATVSSFEVVHLAKNIEISYSQKDNHLYCNWLGFQNKQLIMESGETILEIVKEKGVTHVLNDNSKVTGPWQEAAEWTSTVWFPQMFEAGLEKFAWIFSANIFAELSAKKAMPQTDNIKSFNNIHDAKKWLAEG
ncbi:hypothetical protein AB9P05_10855 [Roseivirga sp. BDSF3-8]|uniref:hypothetical protein n=1 Tax=Roseivirga sp. BDSF3-8 TaxID=3241598 RepID=UPI0035319B65